MLAGRLPKTRSLGAPEACRAPWAFYVGTGQGTRVFFSRRPEKLPKYALLKSQ